MSPINLFLQSLVIILREGLEAILIIGALIAFLMKAGAAHRKRDIHIGVGAAVAMSLLTAVLLETVFVLSAAHREALEGVTMIVAVGVLFYVSYWLLSKMEVAKWTAFVKQRLAVAVTGGSAFALASAAFLAVYREGFETVLFYKALFVEGGALSDTFLPVTAGIAVGGVALAVVYLAINRWGVRLPLKPFFGITSAFLYYMAFVFAGKGVAELQDGGVLPNTILLGWPRFAALGIYPTVESMLAQAIMALLAGAALVWIFGVQHRRDALAYAARPQPAPGSSTDDSDPCLIPLREMPSPKRSCFAHSNGWRPTSERCRPRSSASVRRSWTAARTRSASASDCSRELDARARRNGPPSAGRFAWEVPERPLSIRSRTDVFAPPFFVLGLFIRHQTRGATPINATERFWTCQVASAAFAAPPRDPAISQSPGAALGSGESCLMTATPTITITTDATCATLKSPSRRSSFARRNSTANRSMPASTR